MRAIRTEKYFDNEYGSFGQDKFGSASIAWIGKAEDRELYEEVGSLIEDIPEDLLGTKEVEPVKVNEVDSALEVILKEIVAAQFDWGNTPTGESTIHELLQTPVVIEQSPPVHVILKDIAALVQKNPAGLGAVIGFLAVGQSPMLLVTVPLGIFLVGSAPAITEVLKDGIVRYIKGKLGKKPRGTTPTDRSSSAQA